MAEHDDVSVNCVIAVTRTGSASSTAAGALSDDHASISDSFVVLCVVSVEYGIGSGAFVCESGAEADRVCVGLVDSDFEVYGVSVWDSPESV